MGTTHFSNVVADSFEKSDGSPLVETPASSLFMSIIPFESCDTAGGGFSIYVPVPSGHTLTLTSAMVGALGVTGTPLVAINDGIGGTAVVSGADIVLTSYAMDLTIANAVVSTGMHITITCSDTDAVNAAGTFMLAGTLVADS